MFPPIYDDSCKSARADRFVIYTCLEQDFPSGRVVEKLNFELNFSRPEGADCRGYESFLDQRPG